MAGSSWFSKMVGMSLTLDNLQDLLVQQIEDLYSAETQLIDALPGSGAYGNNRRSLQERAGDELLCFQPREPA